MRPVTRPNALPATPKPEPTRTSPAPKGIVAAAKERIASQVRIVEKIGNRQKLTDKEARELANQVKDLMEGRTRLEVPIKGNTSIIFEKDPQQTTIGVKITF